MRTFEVDGRTWHVELTGFTYDGSGPERQGVVYYSANDPERRTLGKLPIRPLQDFTDRELNEALKEAQEITSAVVGRK
jgi:hypothetical protein